MGTTVERREAEELLASLRAAAGGATLVDAHVHPFDVVFGALRYRRMAGWPGVWSAEGGGPYVPPSVGAVRLRGPLGPATVRPAFFRLLARRLFRHTGPRVLGEQLALAGVDRALLLPVAPAAGSNEAELELLHDMFGGDARFTLATSVPNEVPDTGVAAFVARSVERHAARAVKLHPALTAVDLGAPAGRARADAVLDACRRSGVPLVVHGGRSYAVPDPRAQSFACIENLAAVPWREARVPVCVAHAGCYGLGLDEMERTALPALEAMLAANDNLFADVSALEHDALALVLRRVDVARLLFGSDALYEPPSSAMVKLAFALRRNGMDVGTSIARIAGANPARFLCEGRVRHAHGLEARPAAAAAAAAPCAR